MRELRRCPVFIGRAAELDRLTDGVRAARAGRGSTRLLFGPAGIGKSRLVREAVDRARGDGVRVLVGRALELEAHRAFRPLQEALLGGLRGAPDPDSPQLTGFKPALGKIVPQWAHLAGAEYPPAVTGEGVLRLLSVLAGDTGVLVVFEDLHWADSETLSVVQYLADNIAGERIALVATARDGDEGVAGLSRALVARGSAEELTLGPLSATEVDEMVAACLGRPADVARAAGVPLFVEALAFADGETTMPKTVSDVLLARLRDLAPGDRSVLDAAAVLGTTFDWRVVAEAVRGDVSPALRAATDAGVLVAPDNHRFEFGHALIRDAVFGALPAAERSAWARKLIAAIDALHPDFPDQWCDVVAELALQSENPEQAARSFLRAGERNLAAGALLSAASVLERAARLPGPAGDVHRLLAQVYQQSGRLDRALEAARRSIEEFRRAGGEPARAHLRLARILTAAGQWREAGEQLQVVRRLAPDDAAARPWIAVAEAEIAFGDARFEEAAALARAALSDTRDDPAEVDTAYDALILLGRIARRTSLSAAESAFVQARIIAEAAGRPLASLRASTELAIGDVQETLRTERLRQARARAVELGDLGLTAVLDLQLAATLIGRWDAVEALEAATRCAAASRRLHLPALPKALILTAVAADQLGRTDQADDAREEALRLRPGDPQIVSEALGARAYRLLGAADDEPAVLLLEDAVRTAATRPGEVTGSPFVGFHALATIVVDRARTAVSTVENLDVNRYNRGMRALAEAVASGRQGRPEAARERFEAADKSLREPVDAVWHRLIGRRLVYRAAVEDGWGTPARWAAEDLGLAQGRAGAAWIASLERTAGAPESRLDPIVASWSVTPRERDVLELVARGHSNKQIAEELFLSPRTVEKHVEKLLAKAGVSRRVELVKAVLEADR